MASAQQVGLERCAKDANQKHHDGGEAGDAEPASANAYQYAEIAADPAQRCELQHHRFAGEPDSWLVVGADVDSAGQCACPDIQGPDAGAADPARHAQGPDGGSLAEPSSSRRDPVDGCSAIAK